MVNGRAAASLNFTSSSIRGHFPNPLAAAVGVMIRSVRGTMISMSRKQNQPFAEAGATNPRGRFPTRMW